MSNIVNLAAARAALRPAVPAAVPLPVRTKFPVTGHQRAGRQRNPLRHSCNTLSLAVTVAGQILRNHPLNYDAITDLREGVAAARELEIALQILMEDYENRQR